MTVTFDDIKARESRHVLQTYRRQPVAFARGDGTRLWDVDGREYLDFVSGIAVMSVGHSHPKVVDAIRAGREIRLELHLHQLDLDAERLFPHRCDCNTDFLDQLVLVVQQSQPQRR